MEIKMNYLDELKKLGQLKNDGKLTEEEFQEKKEKILSQSSKTKENKAESGNKKKKGFIARILENKLDDRLETVSKAFEPDQEALKEWKKYLKQYKTKKITLTALRKKAKEIKSLGFRLTNSSIDADLAGLKLANTLQSSAKLLGIKGELGRTRKGWEPPKDTNYKDTNYKDDYDRISKDVYKLLNDNKGRVFNNQDIMDELQIPSTEFDDSVFQLNSLLIDDEEFMKNDDVIFEDGGGVGDDEYSGWLLCIGKTDKTDSLRSMREAEKKRILDKEKQKEDRRVKNLKSSIIKLLEEQGTKIPASDIDAHLKNKNVDEIKEVCEEMYHDGEISRTSNYRYFVLTKKKSKPTQSKQVDIGKELKKYKDLLDQELITQDDYDAKKKELLGL
jgi:hypothetical protein